MEEKKNDTNWGCLILIVLFVGANIYYALQDMEAIAGAGATVLGLAGIALAFYGLPKLFSNNETRHTPSTTDSGSSPDGNLGWKGCLAVIGFFLLVALIVGVMTSSEELNTAVGIIVMLVIAVAIGIAFYSAGND